MRTRFRLDARIQLTIFTIFLVLQSAATFAEEQENFLDLSLEELLDIEVTSVSKKAEKRTEAAAAIFVLTSEDIRRSGATNVPDVLRTVPGLNVARIDSSKWSVTSRGFGGHFSNKLLVLIDGRSVYTPFFSGVYWEARDVMLEDVDRIEIIRGPGGTLWGANAVNGVINIVTKNSADTQGGLVTQGAGTEERYMSNIRYGGELKEDTFYRVYAKFNDRDKGGDHMDGTDADDDWWSGKSGFRIDTSSNTWDSITIQGDMFKTVADTTWDLYDTTIGSDVRISNDVDIRGYNLLGNWQKDLSDDSNIKIKAFYDYYEYIDPLIEEKRGTLDIDFQHSYTLSDRQELIWGLGYRVTHDDFDNTQFIALDPDKRSLQLFSAFIQHQFELTDTVKLTFGTKIEHNDFTGFEVQPSARFAWVPNDNHTVWGAVSRAIRTPNRAEQDLSPLIFQSSLFPAQLAVYGTDRYDSEELIAYELGYRVQINKTLAIDIATFYNDYSEMRNFALAPSITPPPGTLAVTLNNDDDIETYGVEATVDWQPYSWWAVRASYSFLDFDQGSPTGSGPDAPEQTVLLQNQFDLSDTVELNLFNRYIDRLAAVGIDDYFTMDVMLAWRPKDNLEIAVVGQNLIDSERFEYQEAIVRILSTETQRGVYGKVTWNF